MRIEHRKERRTGGKTLIAESGQCHVQRAEASSMAIFQMLATDTRRISY